MIEKMKEKFTKDDLVYNLYWVAGCVAGLYCILWGIEQLLLLFN
jgi:hypothetical protein